MIQCRVLLFAMLKEALETSQLKVELPAGSTVLNLKQKLTQDYPNASTLLEISRIAHQHEYLSDASMVVDDEEYALIPPVSGG